MKFGLLGYPLSHSYSPQIHKELGDYPYQLFPVESHNLDHFFKTSDFAGINVTSPYKKTVIAYCHKLSPSAEKVGCVNTIIRCPDGNLVGHNTDYFGFKFMLSTIDVDFSGKKVLILGSGGAAGTVHSVLSEAGAQPVIISRTGNNNYNNLFLHRDAFAIVNATPVGMYPNTMSSPVDLASFPHLKVVLDLIYNPGKTKLLMDAEKRKLITANGLSMLVAQGKESAELFNGTHISNNEILRIQKEMERQMRNIILIGMPGSGKSTIGKRLSEKLNRRYIDLDEAIKQEYGMTPAEIIITNGEDYFREIEMQVINHYGKQSSLVISTGGGCVMRNSNYYPLHQNGRIYWLNRSLDLLTTDGRPLSLRGSLDEMYRVRAPLYTNFADFVVDNNEDPEVTISKILSLEGFK